MKQRLGDESPIEVWTGKDARGVKTDGHYPQQHAAILWDHTTGESVALGEEEFIILKMTLLAQSDELKRELLRFVHFMESIGVLPSQVAPFEQMHGKLIRYPMNFEQLVDLASEVDQVDWFEMAQKAERG